LKNVTFQLNASLFIGTTLGSVIVNTIRLPDARLNEPVVVTPNGTIFKNKGSVISM